MEMSLSRPKFENYIYFCPKQKNIGSKSRLCFSIGCSYLGTLGITLTHIIVSTCCFTIQGAKVNTATVAEITILHNNILPMEMRPKLKKN